MLLFWLQFSQLSNTYSCRNTAPTLVPNDVHYVYLLSNTSSGFHFHFKHFLSIYSVWYHWRPTTIYLHTNADDVSLRSARGGKSGKWDRLIFEVPGLRTSHVDEPAVAGNGMPITLVEHKSDFIRVSAIHDFGGVYIDWDVHALRDIKFLRESGFNAITGREDANIIGSGTFMAKKNALLLEMWKEEMHRVFDGGWITHSNNVITRLSKRLARNAGEVLILEKDAFFPAYWTTEENVLLYGLHDTPSNLQNFTEGSSLPSYEEGLTDRWTRPQDFPEWERDYSNSYMLHAFNPARNGNPVEGFQHITPEYVFARQSVCARLLYPIAKHMYDAGLVTVNDSYLG